MKKGRHRRFEEARALKRSQDVDFDDLFESISGSETETHKPEHDAWADVAADWSRERDDGDDGPEDEDEVSADAEGAAATEAAGD